MLSTLDRNLTTEFEILDFGQEYELGAPESWLLWTCSLTFVFGQDINMSSEFLSLNRKLILELEVANFGHEREYISMSQFTKKEKEWTAKNFFLLIFKTSNITIPLIKHRLNKYLKGYIHVGMIFYDLYHTCCALIKYSFVYRYRNAWVFKSYKMTVNS